MNRKKLCKFEQKYIMKETFYMTFLMNFFRVIKNEFNNSQDYWMLN